MKEIGEIELAKAIMSLGNNKSAGPSGIMGEHLKHLIPEMKLLFKDILNDCLRLQRIPKEWLISSIFLVPKDKDFDGDLDRMRPITLLEVTRKVLSKILNRRLYTIIDSCDGLFGGNYGFTRGLSTTDVALSLQLMVDHSQKLKKPLKIITTDIRKAYDSVSHFDLLNSLKRLNLPPNFIQLMSFILQNRDCKVITPYGLSMGFRPTKGIEQGDSLAPLLWNIFFDSIISSLRNEPKDAFIVNSFAFADDVTLLGRSDDAVKRLFDVFTAQCSEKGLQINPNKCYFYENERRDITSNFINASQNGHLEIAYKGNDAFRFLGCLITLNGKQTEVLHKLEEQVRHGANILRGKKLSGKIFSYIITAVFQPKILHMAFCSPLLSSELQKLERYWLSMAKKAHILPKYVANATLFNCTYIKKLQAQTDYRQITQFLYLLKKPHAASEAVLAILDNIIRTSNISLFDGVTISKNQKRYLWNYFSNRMAEYGLSLERTPFIPLTKRLSFVEPHDRIDSEQSVNLWTDGSLVVTDEQAKMSSAFILCDDAGQRIDHYACPVLGIPSSTTAELLAILMGLRVLESKKKVHIFTDSQTSILLIEKIIDQAFICDDIYFSRHDNGSILRNIHNEIFNKQLRIKISKVKAHSGVELNEEVDQLASEGHNFSDVRNLAVVYEHMIKVRYKKEVFISPRRHIKFIQAIASDSVQAALLPSHVRDVPTKFRNVLSDAIRSATRGKYFITSLAENKQASFSIKFLYNQLPLMDRLSHWNPLYRNNICKRCLIAKEDKSHFISCPKNEHIFPIITDKLLRTLGKIPESQKLCIGYLLTSNRSFFLSGMPNSSFIESLERILIDDNLTCRTLKRLITNYLVLLKEFIWIPRCKDTQTWGNANSKVFHLSRLFESRNEANREESTIATLESSTKANLLYRFYQGSYKNMNIEQRSDRVALLGRFVY